MKQEQSESPSSSAPLTEPVKRKVGRPLGSKQVTNFTIELVTEIAENMAMGLSAKLACAATNPPTGVESFNSAITRYPEFREILDVAQARFAKSALMDIRSGVQGWQGAAWILERRHKADYSKTEPAINISNISNNFAIPESVINDIGRLALGQFGRKPAIDIGAGEEEARKAKEVPETGSPVAADIDPEVCDAIQGDSGISFGK